MSSEPAAVATTAPPRAQSPQQIKEEYYKTRMLSKKKQQETVRKQHWIVLLLCLFSVPLLYYYYKNNYVHYIQRRLERNPDGPLPQISDFSTGLYSAIIILALRAASYKWLLVPLAAAAVKMQPGWDQSQLKQRREKFQHCLFLVFYYAFATVYGWYVLYDKSWVPGLIVPFASGETVHCWRNFFNQVMHPDVQFYYMLSLGYALQSLIYLVCRSHRRDFLEMFIHHALEISLIVYSYLYGFIRIGTLVLAVHDVGDVFINVTRCTNEARYIKSTMVLFFMLLASWIYFRLYLFPAYVIWTAMVEGPYEIIYNAKDPRGVEHAGYWFFNGMMIGLLILHIFWFCMFLRMIYYLKTQHVVDDTVDEVVNDNETDDGDKKGN